VFGAAHSERGIGCGIPEREWQKLRTRRRNSCEARIAFNRQAVIDIQNQLPTGSDRIDQRDGYPLQTSISLRNRPEIGTRTANRYALDGGFIVDSKSEGRTRAAANVSRASGSPPRLKFRSAC